MTFLDRPFSTLRITNPFRIDRRVSPITYDFNIYLFLFIFLCERILNVDVVYVVGVEFRYFEYATTVVMIKIVTVRK